MSNYTIASIRQYVNKINILRGKGINDYGYITYSIRRQFHGKQENTVFSIMHNNINGSDYALMEFSKRSQLGAHLETILKYLQNEYEINKIKSNG